MEIICISDTHTKHLEIPLHLINNEYGKIEMIIHAGDISGRGNKSEIRDFLDWFSKLPYKYKILIAGNHDFFFERAPEYEIDALLAEYPSITYLNDSGIEIEGFKIWGSPVQPWFYNWAFNRNSKDIVKHWDLIPNDTEILITHGPVYGYLDATVRGDLAGCPNLLDKVKTLSDLRLHVSGHIHEGYGIARMGDVNLINASVLDYHYDMVNDPIRINLVKK
jgi:Icc-related predicted phosphoesterase